MKLPIVDGSETLDGVDTTRIVGTVDLSGLENVAGGTPIAGFDLLILGEMPVTIWLDGEGHVVSLEIEGPLTTSESPDVVRRLDLFDFDLPLVIEAPDNVAP